MRVVMLTLCLAAFANTAIATPTEARVNGGIALIPLPPSAVNTPLFYQGQPVWQGVSGQQRSPDEQRLAVVGIPLEASGSQELRNAEGEVIVRFEVKVIDYPEQRLQLKEQKYVEPDAEQKARFERESAEQAQAYRQFVDRPDALWPRFQWPVAGRLSSPFGLKRFFNDQPRNSHKGIDIAAPKGAIAMSPADGTVRLVGDYFFNGKTVLIDHGQGLISMMCHFDEILASVGQVVKAGDPVGKIGATGRATGPHLHWTVSLNDARIDPRLLLEGEPPN